MTTEKIFETELKKAGYPLTLKKELTTKFVYEYTLSYGEKDTTELPKEVQPNFAKSYAASVIKTIDITEKLHKLEHPTPRVVDEHGSGYKVQLWNDFAGEMVLEHETFGADECDPESIEAFVENLKFNPNFSVRAYEKREIAYDDGTKETRFNLIYKKRGEGLE